MDDRFLESMRREPRPEFARGLRQRLNSHEESPRPWILRPAPAAGLSVAALAVISLFAFPAVRVQAQAVLDLFRVRNFAAVPFDESRMERLRTLSEGSNASALVFDELQTVRDPGPPTAFPNVHAAGAVAGINVLSPQYLPENMSADSVWLRGASEARMTVREQKLRSLLQSLDLNDVTMPPGIDGSTVQVKTSPVVIQTFRSPRRRVALMQTKSPEMSLPSGLDIERLAEIGLRVLGLDSGEARRIARATDWRSTLIVPVPLNASTFRQVTIRGQQGLLVTTSGDGDDNRRHRNGTMLMWTEGDRVVAIVGDLQGSEIVQMAESVR